MAVRSLWHSLSAAGVRQRASHSRLPQLPGISGASLACCNRRQCSTFEFSSNLELLLCIHGRHDSSTIAKAAWGAVSAAVLLASLSGERREVRCQNLTAKDFTTRRTKSHKHIVIPEVQPGEDVILAADCGGTTTRLKFYAVDPQAPIVEKEQPPGRVIFADEYPNILFKSFDKIIEAFFEDAAERWGPTLPRPKVAVFAIAGIVTANQCRYTNLDWIVSGSDIAHAFDIGRVEIINDFVAQGYGVLTLSDDEVVTLNDAPPRPGAPIAVLGAGTGLGVTFLTTGQDGLYTAYPSEAGHMEFAPRGEGCNELQLDLLKHLKIKVSGYTRVSTERVVSGKGICNVYEFLAYRYPERTNEHVQTQFIINPLDTSIIAKNNWPGSLCEDALKIFASCYGAFAGTIAITLIPFRGIYLTGGVTQKLQDWLVRDGSFMKAYRDKGRVSTMLSGIPLYLAKGDDMGQRGAHLRSVRLLHEFNSADTAVQMQDDLLVQQELVAPRDVDATAAQLAKKINDFQERRRST